MGGDRICAFLGSCITLFRQKVCTTVLSVMNTCSHLRRIERLFGIKTWEYYYMHKLIIYWVADS